MKFKMKHIIYRLTFILMGLAVLASCEENEIPILDVDGQVLAQFGSSSIVLPTPEEGTSEEIEVIVTNTSSSERTIEVTVDTSSTATEDQYTISNLVIPANSYTGTFTISSNYDALPETGSTELVLNLVGIGNEGDVAVSNGTLEVEMFRKCPIEPSAFVGQWEGPGVWAGFYGDYKTEVVTSLNAEGELLIDGLAFQFLEDPNFWGEEILESFPVKMIVNEETGEITIPEQVSVTTDYNGFVSDYTVKGTGRILNACEKTMEIYPILTMEDGYVIDGTAWGPKFVEKIKLIQ